MERTRKTVEPEGDGCEPASAAALLRLLEIMRRLRDPLSGCPWDIEQDFQSIAPYTIEEAYEVAEAIAELDYQALRAELGDLLLQVVYHAQMADEAGHFQFSDVAQDICDKMIRRHPHVFGTESRDRSAEQQTEAWERAKADERETSGQVSVVDGVSRALPALTRATKLQKRAARVGFDWPDATSVLPKIAEEAEELVEVSGGPAAAIQEEYGDLLFAVANLGRHIGADPEEALRGANRKFEKRFRFIEERLAERNLSPADASLEEMDAIWEEAKALRASE
mgnify:CR=1 FL=1